MKARKVRAVDKENFPPTRALTVDGLRYRFHHQIGLGAFSTVYKATDEWGHALAVKIYPPEANKSLLENEIKQLRRFAGPGVVYLHRVFVHEEHTYLVLDDVGVPVSRCRFGKPEQRLKAVFLLAREVLPALVRLHLANYCHGDISPQNVLLALDSQNRPKAANLVDFGLCRSQGQLNQGSTVMSRWTPPPEYILKQHLSGTALDIWHLSVLLLEVIKAETLDYSNDDVLNGRPQRDALDLRHPLANVLAKGLSLNPLERPTALELWRAMRATL